MRRAKTIKSSFRVLCFFWIALIPIGTGEAAASSIFSINLTGERLEAGDARTIALGGTFQMIADSLGVLQKNPALLTFCRKVTVGATQFVAVDKARSSAIEEKNVSVSFPVFAAAFPLTKRLTFGIGYRGRFDPDGSFALPGETDSGDRYERIFSKDGGFYAVPFTMALTLSRYVALGASFSLERGSMEDRWDTVYDDITLATGSGFKREEFSGMGYGAGVVLFPGGRLMVGATFESEVEYDADIKERYSQPALDTSYTETIKLPPRISVATTYRVSDSWYVLASFSSTDFKEFRGFSFPVERLYSEESYAVGAEYMKGLPLKGKRFPLRFSFNYQQLPYDYPTGERIRKILFGFGTGLNFADGKAKIDIAIRAGKIGSIDKNTIEDRLVRFYVSVTGSEIWKRKGHKRRF